MLRLRDWLHHPLKTLRLFRVHKKTEQISRLRSRYQIFRALLNDNHRSVELLTELGAALRSPSFWSGPLRTELTHLIEITAELTEKLEHLTEGRSAGLTARQAIIAGKIKQALALLPRPEHMRFCISLDTISPAMLRSVGGKAANLARLRRLAAFSVPAGFVVPVSVCRLFLEQDDLYLQIVARLRQGEKNKEGLPERETVANIKELILAKPLPDELSKALASAAEPFFLAGRGLAVRSSAMSEDTVNHSFAGQYVSVLNVVTLPQLEAAFKTVVASAFTVHNFAYRMHGGMAPYEFDLAILFLEMVDARSAGIMFTIDPSFSTGGNMLISAVHGLGELAVGGSEAADIFRPPRDCTGPGDKQVAIKQRRLTGMPNGGVVEEQLSEESRSQPVLSDEEILALARLGIQAEDRLGGYQDIEWAIEPDGRIVILQARPIQKATAATIGPDIGSGRLPLMIGGQIASPGRCAGMVRIVGTSHDLKELDEPPYVLVMHQSMVEAVSALRQTGGVLVELGNPADHLSCVAREHNIPMLTGLENVTGKLKNGDKILIDTGRAAVFSATSDEMTRHRERHRQKSVTWKEQAARPEDPLVAALYDLIVPLNLTDAYGPTFNIVECRTIHDIIRYAHEKAVLAMFDAGDEAMEQAYGAVVNLQSAIPFHISFIDLGGGLATTTGRWISAQQILSRPFKALWQGIETPGLNWGPVNGEVATGSVMSQFLCDHRSARPIGLPNYALVTRDFINLNARMDFHFTMVDSICGLDARLNYIKFRFKGGGTNLTQRCRRVRCLAEILAAAGFFCDQRDDLLTASIQGGTARVLEEKLRVVGRLLGFSRLLDAAMRSDEMVSEVARAFMEGDYGLEKVIQKNTAEAHQT